MPVIRSARSGAPPFFARRDLPVLTAAEMRAWDRRAVEELGVPERVLMEAAGRSAARLIERLFPRGRIVGVFGSGHNGGDTLIALRTLAAWGRDVVGIPAGERELDRALLHGWELEIEHSDAAAVLAGGDVVVDGILGTGARGAPRPAQAELIEQIMRAALPVVALDGPSGVDLTTGRVAGAAIRADVTITFGAPKRGLLLYPGRSHAGRILVIEIGFPPLRSDEASAASITPAWARARLPGVPPNAHKGTLGTVAVVAGSAGMAGAAALVGVGAARAGAGKVLLVSPAENREILQTALPEALFFDRDSDGLRELLGSAEAVVAGPGIGTDERALRALRSVLQTSEAPLLLDADALTLVAREPELLAGLERPLLMTPHPGELGRLLGEEVGSIVADPFTAAARTLDRFDCTLLLKGPPSVVATRGEPVLLNLSGHSGIATGGMGDTLAGISGALLAFGASPRDAAALALFLSGRAAEIAGRGRSLLPRDVAEALSAALLEQQDAERLAPEVTLDLPAAR